MPRLDIKGSVRANCQKLYFLNYYLWCVARFVLFCIFISDLGKHFLYFCTICMRKMCHGQCELFKSDKKRLSAGKKHCRAPANLFPEELCKESVHCSLTVLAPHCKRTKDREWGGRGGGSLLLTASPVSGPEGGRGAHSVGGGGCG